MSFPLPNNIRSSDQWQRALAAPNLAERQQLMGEILKGNIQLTFNSGDLMLAKKETPISSDVRSSQEWQQALREQDPFARREQMRSILAGKIPLTFKQSVDEERTAIPNADSWTQAANNPNRAAKLARVRSLFEDRTVRTAWNTAVAVDRG